MLCWMWLFTYVIFKHCVLGFYVSMCNNWSAWLLMYFDKYLNSTWTTALFCRFLVAFLRCLPFDARRSNLPWWITKWDLDEWFYTSVLAEEWKYIWRIHILPVVLPYQRSSLQSPSHEDTAGDLLFVSICTPFHYV